MVIYLNVHMAIEQMRQKVEKLEEGKLVGPKVVNSVVFLSLSSALTI